jgi:hypothetical protein
VGSDKSAEISPRISRALPLTSKSVTCDEEFHHHSVEIEFYDLATQKRRPIGYGTSRKSLETVAVDRVLFVANERT